MSLTTRVHFMTTNSCRKLMGQIQYDNKGEDHLKIANKASRNRSTENTSNIINGQNKLVEFKFNNIVRDIDRIQKSGTGIQ